MSVADEFDIEVQPAGSELERLHKVLNELIDQQQMVEELQQHLNSAKEHLHHLRTRQVPDMMAEIQSDHFTFRGYEIKIDDLVSGSLPKDPEAKQRAIAWLEQHDAGGLVKTELSIGFGRSQHNEALNLYARLAEEGLPVLAESGVHPQTLAAWARKRLEEGEPLDPETLGLFVGKVAKLKVVKDK